MGKAFLYSTRWHLLTHLGRLTHICVGKLTIIGSDNGLSPISGRIPRFCQVEIFVLLAGTKQLYEWLVQSVHLSLCLFVCPSHLFTMFPSSYYHEISGVITNERSDVHAKDQGERLKIKVTEVKSPFSSFQTITPVWIHIWWWNDAQSLVLLGRGALLFFKVIHQISSNIEQFL